MNRINIIAGILFLVSLSFSAEPYDKVVAVVDGEIVLESQLMTALYQLQNSPGFNGLKATELRKKVLDRLIDDKVILAKSKMDSVYVTDDELDQRVDQHFDQLKGAQGLNQKQLEQAIETQLGISFLEYRKKMGTQMRDQSILQKMQMKYIGPDKPTPKEVREFYTEYKDSLPAQYNSQRIAHIQIAIEPAESALDSAYKLGKSLILKLNQGVNFERLVEAHSQDKVSKAAAGDIGYFKKGSQDPKYERAAFKLETGQHSARPIRTDVGFYIIKATSRRDNEIRTSHIFLPVTPTSIDTLRAKTLSDSLKIEIDKDLTQFEKNANKYSVDKKSNQKGGDLGWFTQDELKPEYREIVKELGVGNIALPTMIDGKYHIFRLVDKVDVRRLDLESDWTMIEGYAQNILSTRKMQSFTFKWRKFVFIEIRDLKLKELYAGDFNTSPVK
jgi:peptidyl-prolyl cis-trans isomerase SurA